MAKLSCMPGCMRREQRLAVASPRGRSAEVAELPQLPLYATPEKWQGETVSESASTATGLTEQPVQELGVRRSGRAAPLEPVRSSAREVALQLRTSTTRRSAEHCGMITLEMSCDMLCLRTMHVSYTDAEGRPCKKSKTGFNVKAALPPASTNVEVTFSVVGGASVWKVDRGEPSAPWVKDEQGRFVPERFFYEREPPQHVQYFLRGSSLHSWVCDVDERDCSQSLLELVSRDYLGYRTMHVSYTDNRGERRLFSGSGHKVKCHLPSDSKNVEVSFSVMGGGRIQKVDRRDPQLPFFEDANGNRSLEVFFYERVPPCVRYDLRGSVLGARVSAVYEQLPPEELAEQDLEPLASGQADTRAAFLLPPDEVPSVGGLVELTEPHSEFLLPPEVVFHEPEQHEVINSHTGARQIFLNTALTAKENESLAELHRALAKRGIGGPSGEFPKYMEPHALRMLQTCKWDVSKTIEMMKVCVKERVRRMPMAEADILDDLRTGSMYWHGRDKCCRPCMVIRVERLGAIARDKERTIRMVMFALEYAVRYAMVPGRVENWVVLIDLENVFKLISPMNIPSLAALALALSLTLEKVYCGRMVWIKIVNSPGGAFFSKCVNSAIPAEKKDKVNFPLDVKAAMAEHFEPHQLERRYGGTAPDLLPEETYPYRFFPNCTGSTSTSASPTGAADAAARQPVVPRSFSNVRESEEFSLHQSTSLAFHEGALWDDSSAAARRRWLDRALASSLTPDAAQALAALLGRPAGEVEPCRDMASWLELMNPAALQGQRMEWSTRSDRSSTSDGGDSSEPSCPDAERELSPVVRGASCLISV